MGAGAPSPLCLPRACFKRGGEGPLLLPGLVLGLEDRVEPLLGKHRFIPLPPPQGHLGAGPWGRQGVWETSC